MIRVFELEGEEGNVGVAPSLFWSVTILCYHSPSSIDGATKNQEEDKELLLTSSRPAPSLM